MVVTIVDLVLLVVLAGAFALGFYQGAIRQLLGIAVVLIAFVVAANLRAPLGGWLSRYWTQFPRAYNELLAFLALFLILLVVGNVIVQVAYRRTPFTDRAVFLDDLLGGLLGVGLGILIIASLLIILRGAQEQPGVPPRGIGFLSDLRLALEGSAVGETLERSLIPGLLTVLGPLLPDPVA